MKRPNRRSCYILLCLGLVLIAGGLLAHRYQTWLNRTQVLADVKTAVSLQASRGPQWLTFETESARIVIGCDQLAQFADAHAAEPSSTGEPSVAKSRREIAGRIQTQLKDSPDACADARIGLDARLASYLIEAGWRSVYDIRDQQAVESIVVWRYEFSCGPLCGRGTRSFSFRDGRQFLVVVDWMS